MNQNNCQIIGNDCVICKYLGFDCLSIETIWQVLLLQSLSIDNSRLDTVYKSLLIWHLLYFVEEHVIIKRKGWREGEKENFKWLIVWNNKTTRSKATYLALPRDQLIIMIFRDVWNSQEKLTGHFWTIWQHLVDFYFPIFIDLQLASQHSHHSRTIYYSSSCNILLAMPIYTKQTFGYCLPQFILLSWGKKTL